MDEEVTETVATHDDGIVYVERITTLSYKGQVISQQHAPTREIYPNDSLDGESDKVRAFAEIARQHASKPLAFRAPLDRDQ